MKKYLLIVFALVMGVSVATAQSRGGLRINEVMTSNEGSVVDEFGNRGAWIELFNSNFAPLEISSVYLTTDSAQPKMYPVPLGDVNTRLPKRQHIIFWADGYKTRGTFHTNFTLDPTVPNWIGIYDANGITLIDSVTVPVLLPNTSYGRVIDGETEYINAEGVAESPWMIFDDTEGKYVTPSSNNRARETNPKIEYFHQSDKSGFSLTIMAMCIVFGALLLLCICFMIINKISTNLGRINKLRSHGVETKDVALKDLPDHDSGEEIAAIVMALHEHLNTHDQESTILTINKVKRAYSPWSSKIYSIREVPKR